MSREKENRIKSGLYLIGFGGWLIFSGIRRFRRKRDIEDTPTSKIRSAPQGSIEVQGYAWPIENSGRNNLNGEKCVFRHLEVMKKVGSGKKQRWIKVHEDRYDLPFLVFDQTGTLLVDQKRAEYELRQKVFRWNDLKSQTKQALSTEISVSGFPPSGGLFGSPFKFQEKYILAGSPVYLRGSFSSPEHQLTVDPEEGFLEFQERVRTATAESGFSKLLDQNRNGEICEEEARTGFSASAAFSLRRRGAAGVMTCVGLMKSDTFRRLYISDCHQHHLIKRLGNWNLLMIVGGATMIGAGVFILLSEFENKQG